MVRKFYFLFTVICLLEGFFSFEAVARSVVDDGYMKDVREEQNRSYKDLELGVKNPDTAKPQLQQQIFNHTLSKEFQRRYEDTFGNSQAELIFSLQGVTGYQTFANTRDEQLISDERRDKQRQYANFMFRRLAEYHVDDYFKSDPQMRPVWELKERVSKLDVKVSEGVSALINYSYSGNYADVVVKNPWLGSSMRVNMDPSAVGPSDVKEVLLILDKPVTSTIGTNLQYAFMETTLRTSVSKTLASNMSLSLTELNYLNPKQTMDITASTLAGFHYIF